MNNKFKIIFKLNYLPESLFLSMVIASNDVHSLMLTLSVNFKKK